MAKPPKNPRPPTRRKRSDPPERKRSHLGRVAGLAIGAVATTGVLTGLYEPTAKTPAVCGGSERWNVKVAKDADAATGKINLNATPFSVPQINQQVQPGLIDPAGRMEAEKKQYTVRGFLSFFKKEGDRDYHVVITDKPGQFGTADKPSLVVEFPNPDCFGGKPDVKPDSSVLGQPIAGARTAFEQHIKGLAADKVITKPIPVTVTGIGFFDRFTVGSHEPTGHAKVYSLPDGRQVVLELHPVTEITFDNEPDPNPD